MRKRVSFAIRIVLFSLIACFVISIVNYVITPKKYFEDLWPTTSTYKGFYKMDKDTVDVVFLGSSHAAAAFNPQVIYDKYGITSYNLACEQQNLVVSYYWLKEALKYQKPSAVVVETNMLYTFDPTESLNTSESFTRMAMDAMKWSDVKWEAIHDICRLDPKQTVNSYIFRNVRFHNRWMELSENDFEFLSLENHYELKGFSALSKRGDSTTDYEPILISNYEAYAEPEPVMVNYLDKIVELCKDNEINLILTKTPSTGWDENRHNAVQEYASENGVEFCDFNEYIAYTDSEFDWAKDMNDDWHTNIWGAKRVSKYIAKLLQDDYGVEGAVYDSQWADTREYYEQVVEDCKIANIKDIDEYLEKIDKPRYTVLVAAKNDMSFCVTDAVKKAFSKMGFMLPSKEYDGYCAVKNEEDVSEDAGMEPLHFVGSVRDKMVDYSVTSKGYYAGSDCSIKIDDVEYAKKWDGINIVVYCNDTRKVIDSVVYDGGMNR
ncbi:hypothetical protein [Butyrivibrio sp. INlla16]|uniref:hypothetical protein n=1 Tax=Butyrivibrio sp. INlla16 TaxID=1520807 RepID=UPI000891133E|nr:hypothetical protein [Butyrivibrio sp. INlla16]SDB65397.1 hypothetical protein SAMN02910263_03713 [Butyrivibrio sp. INlla16]